MTYGKFALRVKQRLNNFEEKRSPVEELENGFLSVC